LTINIKFIKRGAIIAWGITPALTEELNRESLETLAPSRCCLVNTDKTLSVNKSSEVLKAPKIPLSRADLLE
jgi:hypothetical protein